MIAEEAYVLSKSFTNNSLKGVTGTLAGKNCTIKSATKADGVTTVVFAWTADDGTEKTTTIQVNDGTNDYEDLINRPKIEGVDLIGNKTFEDLGAASATDLAQTDGHLQDLADLVGDKANLPMPNETVVNNIEYVDTKADGLIDDLVNTNQILNILNVKNENTRPMHATYDNLLLTKTGLFPRLYGLGKNKKYRLVIKPTNEVNISLKAFKEGSFLNTYVSYQTIHKNETFITDIFWEYNGSDVSLCVVNETTSDLSPMYIGIYDITDLNNIQISMIDKPIALFQKYNLLTWYQNKKLTALGDSVTEQGRYLNFLKDILYFNTIQNCGEGGTTVAGISPHAMNNDERINKMDNDSDVVLFMGGINDWVQNIQLGTIDNTDVSTFYGALNSIAEKLTNKYPTKLVVFMGTTYAIYHGNQFSEDGLKNANGLTTKDYSECIMNVAKKYGIPFVDLYGNCGWNKFNISSFVTNDGAYLHPNENGGKRMGRIIYSKLIELMPSDYIS